MTLNKKNIIWIVLVLIILILLTVIIVMSVYLHKQANSDQRQRVLIEIINPETNEPIKDHGTISISYSQEVQIPEIRFKLKGKDIYLTDEDFENRNLDSHIILCIEDKEDGIYHGYKDWREKWPKEIGQYEMQIYFNYIGDKSYDANYYESWISFTLVIKE